MTTEMEPADIRRIFGEQFPAGFSVLDKGIEFHIGCPCGAKWSWPARVTWTVGNSLHLLNHKRGCGGRS